MFLIDIHVFLSGKINTQNLLNHLFQYKMNYVCNSKFFTHMHTYTREITLSVKLGHKYNSDGFTRKWVFCSETHAEASIGPIFFSWFNSIDFNRVTSAEIWLTDFSRSNIQASTIKVFELRNSLRRTENNMRHDHILDSLFSLLYSHEKLVMLKRTLVYLS